MTAFYYRPIYLGGPGVCAKEPTTSVPVTGGTSLHALRRVIPANPQLYYHFAVAFNDGDELAYVHWSREKTTYLRDVHGAVSVFTVFRCHKGHSPPTTISDFTTAGTAATTDHEREMARQTIRDNAAKRSRRDVEAAIKWCQDNVEKEARSWWRC